MNISRIRDVKLPCRGTEVAAGIDFFIPNDMEWESKVLTPGEAICIPSGIKAAIPKGYMLMGANKSGIALKQGLQFGAQICDEDYQGEIHIHLINISNKNTTIQRGQKIIQFILVPVFYDSINEVKLEELYNGNTERREGAFGSTGI